MSRHWIVSIALTATLFASPAAGSPTYPKLFFRYSFLYDSVCATREEPVDPAWATEARERQDEFSALWEREASGLFQPIFLRSQRGFSRREMTATLSACAHTPSFSDPLVLNVTRFLRSFMGERPPRSEESFVDLVFHELLHTWLVENLDWRNSPLLQKYRNEGPRTKSHMHLMAVQIYTYQTLGRTKFLETLEQNYRRTGGDYLRAWEIVALEGREAFLSELPAAGFGQEKTRDP